MWRKANRLAGGNLEDHCQRGEWAELYFMMQAAGYGMKVSRPFGVSGKYDVGVEDLAKILRVQVKSTNCTLPTGAYSVNISASQGKRYEPGTIDFFGVLLIPIDRWYIIPFDAMESQGTNLYFPPTHRRRQKYRQYQEAWHLLKDTGLTIQACADPDWPDVEADELGVMHTDSGILDSAGPPASRVILVRS
jgi:hypothetical protein